MEVAIDSLSQWLEYIQSMHHTAIDLGLSRVLQMANSLDLGKFNCPVITVGGTNGKGSTVACLEGIYQKSGYKVVSYTSPHILKFNERIRIDKNDVDDLTLISAFNIIEKHRKKLNITLSFFEFTTLAALWIFKQISPDVVIIEVGLGGRLDATNIVDNDIAIITSISIDHTEWLGDTREKIAYEKFKIARKDKILICGEIDLPDNIYTLIEEIGVKFFLLERDFSVSEIAKKCRLKSENVALAIKAVDLLSSRLPVDYENILMALSTISLCGRFERINVGVDIIMDVAHNYASVKWLADQVIFSCKNQKIVAVFGAMKDKALSAMLKPMLPIISEWYMVDLPTDRAASSAQLAQSLNAQEIKKCYTFSSVSGALDDIVNKKSADCILVFGSFYTVADAKNWLAKQGESQNGN